MEIGIVAATTYEDNTLTAQPVLFGDDATAAPGEAYHPLGLVARPNDPEVDQQSGAVTNGARVLYVYEGSTLHTLVLDDPRATQKLPQLAKGEAAFYSPGAPDTAHARYYADGNLLVNVPMGKTIKGGGNDARALAHSAETVALFTILNTLILGFQTVCNDSTVTTVAQLKAALLPYITAAVTGFTTPVSGPAPPLVSLPTVKQLGT
jgi:hypothetical protein